MTFLCGNILLKVIFQQKFFSSGLSNWIEYFNLKGPDISCDHGSWPILYGVMLNNLWFSRNQFVFSGISLDPDQLLVTVSSQVTMIHQHLWHPSSWKWSKVIVKMVQKKHSNCLLFRPLLEEIIELLRQPGWMVSLHHVFREANRSVDILANLAHQSGFEREDFLQPPSQLIPVLGDDFRGMSFPRLVS